MQCLALLLFSFIQCVPAPRVPFGLRMARVTPVNSSDDVDAVQSDPYTAPGCCFPLKKAFMRLLVGGRRRGASKRRSSAQVLETLVDELKTEVRSHLERWARSISSVLQKLKYNLCSVVNTDNKVAT